MRSFSNNNNIKLIIIITTVWKESDECDYRQPDDDSCQPTQENNPKERNDHCNWNKATKQKNYKNQNQQKSQHCECMHFAMTDT